MPKVKGNDKGYIIQKCLELIKCFNPVTHSIDTHCLHHLGDVTAKDSKPENVFIQQVVYGWYRERRVLEVFDIRILSQRRYPNMVSIIFISQCFIENFYADNAARLLRIDMMLYTILAYLALFRLDELGFVQFKEFAMTQDPQKVFNFAAYLFNKV